MKAGTIATAAVLAVLLGAGNVLAAEGLAGRFAIAGQVGTQTEISGELLRSGQGTIAGRPVTIDSSRYRDVYAPKVRVQGFLGYGVSERVELVLRGGWYKSDGTGVSAGDLAGKELFAYFTDYEEGSVELAARYYIAFRTKLKSYIAPVAGVRWSKSVYASYSIPDAGTAVLDVPFNEKTTVGAFGLDIGVSYDLTESLFIGLDSGIRWQGAPTAAGAYPGLGSVDQSESRWTAPVLFSLGVRF